MPTFEYCQIELCEERRGGFFKKIHYSWEAQKITPQGKEILFRSEEFPRLYSGDPQKEKEDERKERAAREAVVSFLLARGWTPDQLDEHGVVAILRRPLEAEPTSASASAAAPAPAAAQSIIQRLETLKEVHASGLISDEEYAAKRSEILREI